MCPALPVEFYKIQYWKNKSNFETKSIFSLCYPPGTHGFPQKFCPALWPAIAHIYKIFIYERREEDKHWIIDCQRKTKNGAKTMNIKETVSDALCKDDNVQFTIVPLKVLSDQVCIRTQCFLTVNFNLRFLR